MRWKEIMGFPFYCRFCTKIDSQKKAKNEERSRKTIFFSLSFITQAVKLAYLLISRALKKILITHNSEEKLRNSFPLWRDIFVFIYCAIYRSRQNEKKSLFSLFLSEHVQFSVCQLFVSLSLVIELFFVQRKKKSGHTLTRQHDVSNAW